MTSWRYRLNWRIDWLVNLLVDRFVSICTYDCLDEKCFLCSCWVRVKTKRTHTQQDRLWIVFSFQSHTTFGFFERSKHNKYWKVLCFVLFCWLIGFFSIAFILLHLAFLRDACVDMFGLQIGKYWSDFCRCCWMPEYHGRKVLFEYVLVLLCYSHCIHTHTLIGSKVIFSIRTAASHRVYHLMVKSERPNL